MVVLNTDGGTKLILHRQRTNTIEVCFIQSSNRGAGIERLELKDSFLFKNKREFVELMADLLNGARDSFVFPLIDQESEWMWEMDCLGASGYLVRLYFYKGKVEVFLHHKQEYP
ncbi:hypothetical protein [Paenibacillus mendelii]|uniref:Uncharacterized protein n=1 Tax=Paenibacillus mendelii TaxID=206163 RepID=A0ABV6JGR1_9BACL|nr:hypothetical protein [Paenibacillus mendelii]MCQ6557508.1 hypothetical protein [Paenibacillus mendelii]